MISASSLPLELWAEAVATAVYVRNRTTNSRAGDKTPFELFYGRKPNLSHLVEFGQEVHIFDYSRWLSKFSSKTIEAYAVGYGQRVNTYCCLIRGSKEIRITSDVVPAAHKTSPVQNNSHIERELVILSSRLAHGTESTLPFLSESDSQCLTPQKRSIGSDSPLEGGKTRDDQDKRVTPPTSDAGHSAPECAIDDEQVQQEARHQNDVALAPVLPDITDRMSSDKISSEQSDCIDEHTQAAPQQRAGPTITEQGQTPADGNRATPI